MQRPMGRGSAGASSRVQRPKNQDSDVQGQEKMDILTQGERESKFALPPPFFLSLDSQ